MAVSPYDVPGFYDRALETGKHRDIVGGRWDETGRMQMQILHDIGVAPDHHLLDIGAGSLRLGCKAVEHLNPGHYWATDASRALMLRGRDAELSDPSRLPPDHLIEDARFDFPDVPNVITHAICFAVFTHLPLPYLRRALTNLQRFDSLQCFAFTVFLAPDAQTALHPYRQPDGVVTHDIRAPYHMVAGDVEHVAQQTGWTLTHDPRRLPRGQVLYQATRV